MDPEVVNKGFSSPAFIQEGLPVIAVLMVVLTATGFGGRVGFGVISSNDIGLGVLGKNVCSCSLVSSTSSLSSVNQCLLLEVFFVLWVHLFLSFLLGFVSAQYILEERLIRQGLELPNYRSVFLI